MIHEEIHHKALAVSQRLKASERELQEVLQEIDHHRTYLYYGHSSLFKYAVDALGLSPDVAYNHISVARKSREIPELKKAIDEQTITLSQARHITSVITQENQTELISLAVNCTREELKKEIAKIAPEKETHAEKARYVSDTRVALEVRVSETLMKKLRRAQDLVAESQRKFSTLEEALEAMVDCFLEKRDPMEKAKRAQNNKDKKSSDPNAPSPKTCTGTGDTTLCDTTLRVPVPTRIKNTVLIRDEGQCTQITTGGQRCPEKRWLHFHHIKPVREGGQNILENFKLVCSGHHRSHHFRLELEKKSKSVVNLVRV